MDNHTISMGRQLSLFQDDAYGEVGKTTRIPLFEPPLVREFSGFPIAKIHVSMKPSPDVANRPRVMSSEDSERIFRETWPAGKMALQECFRTMFLNSNHRVLGVLDAYFGGISAVSVDIRIIFAVAVQAGATGLILAHNHPSGSLMPSEADRKLTKQFQAAGSLLQIRILDHLILSPFQEYASMADEGEMPSWNMSVQAATAELGINPVF